MKKLFNANILSALELKKTKANVPTTNAEEAEVEQFMNTYKTF